MRLDWQSLRSFADHRPWPPPRRDAVMEQTWDDLLFAHWEVPAESLTPLLPPSLELDTWQGRAWISITPFVLTGLRMRGLPAVPGLSRFPELNVRTYVRGVGLPGIHFFSLDAGHAVAVAGARKAFFLPYYRANMSVRKDGRRIHYSSRRAHPGAPDALFSAEYEPAGPAFTARLGSLDHWLTERYCFFTTGPNGVLYRGEIHHRPWSLQPADGVIRTNTLAPAAGLALPGGRPTMLHYSKTLEVAAWTLTRASQFESEVA